MHVEFFCQNLITWYFIILPGICVSKKFRTPKVFYCIFKVFINMLPNLEHNFILQFLYIGKLLQAWNVYQTSHKCRQNVNETVESDTTNVILPLKNLPATFQSIKKIISTVLEMPFNWHYIKYNFTVNLLLQIFV